MPGKISEKALETICWLTFTATDGIILRLCIQVLSAVVKQTTVALQPVHVQAVNQTKVHLRLHYNHITAEAV